MAEVCTRRKVPDNDLDNWRWKCTCNHLLFAQARKQEFHTDVVFNVGGGGKLVKFAAHKIFLAIFSPQFEAMFYENGASNENPIQVDNIEPHTFEMLMRYIYGESIIFRSIPSAGKIYRAADKFLLHGLKYVVQHYLFWEISKQERYLDIPFYKRIFLDFFKNNACCLLESEKFDTLSHTVVELILKMDVMRVKECDLLMGLCRWGIADAVPECPKLKIKFPYLLGYIRFSNISLDEFKDFLDEFPRLITWDDTLTITKHLFDCEFKLPNWCSTDKRLRNSKMYL